MPVLTACAIGYLFGKLLTASGVAEAAVERVYAASSAGTPDRVVRAGRFACYVTDKSKVATLGSVVRAELEFIRGTAGSEVLCVGFEPWALATAKQVQQRADELRHFLGISNQGIERVRLNFSLSVVRKLRRERRTPMEILCVVCDTEPSYEKCRLPMLLQSGFLAEIEFAVTSHPVLEKYVTDLLGRLDSPSFERAELGAIVRDWRGAR